MSEETVQAKVLNLAQMQLELDQLVFDYIDTSNNWSKAKQQLEEMNAQFEQYYLNYLKKGEGLPKSNSFWGIFMDLIAKIHYFIAYTNEKLGSLSNEQLVECYLTVSKFIPNHSHESNEELYEELKKSYENVANQPLQSDNNTLEQAILSYNDYIQK